jgi:glycine cleavage system transcriptional repressor
MAMTTSTQNYLVLQALGADKQGTLDSLSRACTQSGCQILDSRWVVLGEDFSFGALLRGSWSAIAKLETALPKLEQKLASSIMVKRTQPSEKMRLCLPYSIQIISQERPGVIEAITAFLTRHEVHIGDMKTETYLAPRTHAPMLLVDMVVSIPAKVSFSTLRDDFIVYCEDHNLDAVMDPYKN